MGKKNMDIIDGKNTPKNKNKNKVKTVHKYLIK